MDVAERTRRISDVERRIVKVCRDNNLRGGIVDGFATPQLLVWRLALADHHRKDVNCILRLGNALSLALRTQVRIGEISGFISVEVPLPNNQRRVLPIGDLPPPHGLRIPIGIDMALRPFWLDFNEHPHLLLLGATKQAGKTETLRTIIYQLAAGNTPEEVQFVLVDLKNGQGLDVFEGIAHAQFQVARTAEDAMHAIKWLCEEMKRRYETKTAPYPIFLCIDEALLLTKGWAGTDNALGELTAISRGASIHVIISIQRANRETLKTSMVGSNVLDRICGCVENGQASYLALTKEQAGAHMLLGNGDVLTFIDKHLARVQVGFTHPDLIAELERGGGQKPIPLCQEDREKRGRGGHNKLDPTPEMVDYFMNVEDASQPKAKKLFGIGTQRAKRALEEALARKNGHVGEDTNGAE